MGKLSRWISPGSPFVQAAIAEFIGTFILVLTISTARASGSPVAPIGIGLGLTALIFTYAYLSMAQYNPAVSLGLYLADAQPGLRTLGFIVVQITAAILSAFLASGLVPNIHKFPLLRPYEDSSEARAQSFGVELIFTFAIVSAFLNAVASRQAGNGFFGVAIGATAIAGVIASGHISSGHFNPAVTIGLQLAALRVPEETLRQYPTGDVVRPISTIYLYLLAEFIGAMAAIVVYHVVDEPAKRKTSDEYAEMPEVVVGHDS